MKATSILIGAFICCCIILTGCQDFSADDFDRLNYGPTAAPQAMVGNVTGTASSIYTLSSGTVTCSDSAAEYTLSLAKDNKLPGDTLLTAALPASTQYFRLDITAVLRILENGKCLERDPSDDRVHLVVEGSFGGLRIFTPLNCSKVYTLSDTQMAATADYVVSGEITCVVSEQMKYTFSFSNLALK